MAPPTLLPEWQKILKYSWTVRFTLVAGVLSAADAGFSLLDAASTPLPHSVFVGLAAFFSGAALVSRLLAQKELSGGA